MKGIIVPKNARFFVKKKHFLDPCKIKCKTKKDAMFFEKNLLHPIDIYLITGYNIDTIKKGERKNENLWR